MPTPPRRSLSRSPASRAFPVVRLAAVLAFCLVARPLFGQRTERAGFSALVTALSEPGGFFDSDNLISNETSYLHVMTRLGPLLSGGAYIGVGPDQNYSYMAALRPQVAYMLDVRRDNALQHLLFKALFQRSRNRLEYLCRWLGCRLPNNPDEWTDRPILELLAWADSTALSPVDGARERRETLRTIEAFGVPLDARDRETIERFHGEFMHQRLELRFESFGRGNASTYPTLRRLLLERDLAGAMRSYLTSDALWRVIRDMHADGRIVPVIGDLSGPKAVRAIGDDVRRRGLVVTALYTSNAEMYVWRAGGFERFAENVLSLPLAPHGVVIRSYFNRGSAHPLAVRGHMSVQLLQRFSDFERRYKAGELETYTDIVTRDARDDAPPTATR